MAQHPSPRQAGPDGYSRPLETERQLNQAFATLFRGPAAELVLDYLRSITTHAVCGPEIGANALFHREGMRFLAGIIEQRIKLGRSLHVDVPEPEPGPGRRRSARRAGPA